MLLNKRLLKTNLALLMACGLLLACGCGPTDPSAKMMADANGTKQKQLANLYSMYSSRHNWTGPADEAKFVEFIDGLPDEQKKKMLVNGSASDLLTNDRDGQKFKIRYAVVSGMGVRVPVIFEETGVGGERIVCYTNMKDETVTDEGRYKDLWEGKAGKEGMNREEPKPNN